MKEISPDLLAWYERHARDLPWRAPPGAAWRQEPYHVWLSEIMLQQTTVATVKDRYTRFVARWPGIMSLAAAPQEAVLDEWAGLGYYARARNLHKCAQLIALQDGVFPSTEAGLRNLPGIGPYTAAAIAAIAFDSPAVVMDGNIERVMARLFNEEAPLPAAKPKLKEYAAHCTPSRRAGDHAQALMDLGALICTPRKPHCVLCPIKAQCAGLKAGRAAQLPHKAPKPTKPVRRAYFYLARNSAGEILIEKRPEKGLLGGMYGLPTHLWVLDKSPIYDPPFAGAWVKRRQIIRHTFTHFHLDIEIWELPCEGPHPDKAQLNVQGLSWHNPNSTGLPTVFTKAL